MDYLKQFLVSTLLLLIVLSFNLIAQQDPVEWEEIPIEDLKMKSCSSDTAASALILCDFGVTDFDNELNLIFTRHLRVKIFNENGYHFGTHEISLDKERQHIDEIEAVTYWLGEDDEINSAELDEDDIKEEEFVEGRISHTFTMPSLKPGCIIEIRYSTATENLFWVKDWTFQYSEPVRWSEYRLIFLQNISYSAVTRGFEPYYINETIPGSRIISSVAMSYTGNQIGKTNTMRWVVKDAPAVRNEPFITCADDYKNKVEIQLAGWAIPGHGVKTFLKDWTTFVNELLDAEWFGGRITMSGNIKKLAGEITKGLTDPREKIIKLYDWVRKSIVWDGTNRKGANKALDDVIEVKKGSSAEINLLLLSLLRCEEITCDPLIMSTRENGLIQSLYPIESQFNYVITRAAIGNNLFYLDATDPNRPYDLLPNKLNNVKALVVKKGSAAWDYLKCNKRNLTVSNAILDLDNEGKLSGYFETSLGEYNSLNTRYNFASTPEKDVVKKVLNTEQYGFQVDSFNVDDKENINETIKIKAYVSAENYSQMNGNLIYLNPMLIYRIEENPFKTAKRKFPVDYGYKRQLIYVVTINIPEGYEIQEMLKNITLVAKGSDITYTRKAILDGNQFRLSVVFDIKEVEIKPSLYNNLKEFYSQILTLELEQLVLSKKNL